MKFLLVIILGLNTDLWFSSGETHVAIIMPDEETCEQMREAYVHAVDIRWHPDLGPDGADPEDPFAVFQDVRKTLEVKEVRCERATDNG